MASKKSGRLAGLAALAGLAYMATRDKDKGKGAKDTAAENNRIADAQGARDEQKGPASKPSEVAKKPDVDLGEIRDEEGTLSKFRRNTETGETYDPIGSSPAKVASVLKTPSAPASPKTSRFAPVGSPVLSDNPRKIGNAKAVVAQGGDRSARSDMVSPGPNPARAPGGVGKRGGVGDGGQSMIDRQNAGAKRAGLSVDDYITSGKKTIDEQDGTFNRGGKVKKMASGGMTSSASKRADGIASKGKTRGRMC